MSDKPYPLSKDQVAFFHENGFLAIDSITTAEEVESVRELYDQLFAAQVGREKGDHFDLGGPDEEGQPSKLQQMLTPGRYAPEFTTLLCRRNALAAAKQLLGEETEDREDHAILKPAGVGAPTPWHQDESYWDPKFEYLTLSVWIPLQEATLENGCMQFIPGSHRLEVLPHRPIGNDPRVHGLEVDVPIETERAVACPIPAGGATFHLSRTLHYTGENRTNSPRRAYIITFGHPPKPYPGERRFPWLEGRKTAREKRAAGNKEL
ncbi:MAG: phytanoyl-CoA dioxygenase family protein [Candidatus Omnitrophica bacterium]|nr:phytanoyl-CoA dioxygenase family protein [Candidatus Omnitrophota bacterium]